MKHTFLYTGLLGALLSLGANQLYADEVSIASNDQTGKATRTATPDPVALKKLFHSPKFNVIDPVDDSARDWNGFTPLGNVVTHEMRAAAERTVAKSGE